MTFNIVVSAKGGSSKTFPPIGNFQIRLACFADFIDILVPPEWSSYKAYEVIETTGALNSIPVLVGGYLPVELFV